MHGYPRLNRLHRQRGQGMVEYVVILAFCVLVLLSAQSYDVAGTNANIFVHIRNVIQDNYRGYSYSISLSDTPIHDNLGEYLIDSGVVDPINPHEMIEKVRGYTTFPTLDDFPDGMPNSASDVLDGALSFF
ncbi:MAG: hypothetical protein ACI9SC_000110 [Gammaproteobacteria bacterium]|jgi:hypothetical protein